MIQEVLKEGKLAQILIQIAEGRKSGILTIEYQKVKKIICFENGVIRYATSNMKNEWFIEHLVHAGVIEKKSMTNFTSEPAISEKAAQLMTNAGLLSEQKAILEAHNLIIKITRSCFRMLGRMQFAEGKPDLRGKITTIAEPKDVILEYYRAHAPLFECKMILGKEDIPMVLDSGALEKVRTFTLSNLERSLLKMIDGISSAKALTRIISSPPEETMRGLTILKVLGIIHSKDKSFVEKKPVDEQISEASSGTDVEDDLAEEDAEEKKYYYDLYERLIRNNFFQILGVNRNSTAEEIRTNYYNLAKELHPDRFQKESMKDIKPLIESLFSRICEAYNTLLDKESRKKYETEIFGESEIVNHSLNEKMDRSTLAKGNFAKGRKLYEEGKYNEALKFLENAVTLDPTRWEYFLQLGLTQSKNPRMRSEAIISFKKVIVMNPTSAVAYLELGILYKKCGRIDEAKHMLRCALQWEPDNTLAAFELKEAEKGV